MTERKLLYWILIAFFLNRLCSALPSYVYFDPFPFYDLLNKYQQNVGITLQSYVYFITDHVKIMLIMLFCAYVLPGKFQRLFVIFFWFECFSLVDFLLIYEQPIAYIGSYGIEFTDIKLIFYTTAVILWSHGKFS